MLLLAAVAMVAMPDWVPARWFSKDPATLKLVESTPVNCLLMEKADWSPEFTRAAAEKGIATLGVVRGNANAADIAAEARKAGLTGLAVEGSLSAGPVGMPVVELTNRAEIAGRVRRLRAEGRDVFVFFKHEETPAGAVYAEELLKS